MLLNELVEKVARDLAADLTDSPELTVEVWPHVQKDGRLGYEAVATYAFRGMVTDWSVTGRHPLTGKEQWWHHVYARHEADLGPSGAARAATLTVFGFDPGAADEVLA